MKRLLLFLCLVSACPSSPSAQSPNSAESPASKILVVIDKSTQEMKVFVDNVERYTWKVSTGLPGYETPSGTYPARSMNKIWYSKQWDDAPMPHAIFFTKKGHAIHGTDETKKLGRLASHGCVRLAPKNARTLFALIKEKGLKDTQIVLNGEAPSSEVQVASPAPPKPEKKPPQADTQIVLNEEMPSSEVQVASPALPKPEKKPPKASAADEAEVNAAKSPRRKTGNERLQPKIGTAATKSVNEKDLSASATKRLAHKEKRATPNTASRSRSRPFLLGTPARSSPARVSPSLANAAYATNVHGALRRNKPRSVGASGSVTVSFAIGASGSLRNARVARSSGKALLDQAALAIIRQGAPFPPPPGSGKNYTIRIDFR
jgi:TonB family protein